MKNLLLLSLVSMLSCGVMGKKSELKTVPFVDVQRYAGKWYEIASFPQSFQKGCHCTTAEYSPTDKGYLIVENRCNKGGTKALYLL